MVSSFREIVSLWDSPDDLAGEIGVGIAAVRKWPQRDRIPAEWWAAILKTPRVIEAGITADTLAQLAAREPAEAAE